MRVRALGSMVLLATALVGLAGGGGSVMGLVGLGQDRRPAQGPEASPDALMRADEDFAAATAEHGIDGWMSFMTEDAVRMPEPGGEIVSGHAAIRLMDAPLLDSDEVLLTWRPERAYVFADRTYGLTTGSYETRRRSDGETVGRGHYVTLWRRTADAWRVVFDTGTADDDVER